MDLVDDETSWRKSFLIFRLLCIVSFWFCNLIYKEIGASVSYFSFPNLERVWRRFGMKWLLLRTIFAPALSSKEASYECQFRILVVLCRLVFIWLKENARHVICTKSYHPCQRNQFNLKKRCHHETVCGLGMYNLPDTSIFVDRLLVWSRLISLWGYGPQKESRSAQRS